MPRRLGSVAVLSLLLIISSSRVAPPEPRGQIPPVFFHSFLRHAVAATPEVSRMALELFYFDASMSRVALWLSEQRLAFSYSGRAEAVSVAVVEQSSAQLKDSLETAVS